MSIVCTMFALVIFYIHQCSAAVDEKPDLIKAKYVMQQHQQKVIVPAITEEINQRVYIRRNRLFTDSLRAFSRPTFVVSKMLKVNFIGESAIDDGGPRREYFQLLIHEAFSKSGSAPCIGDIPDYSLRQIRLVISHSMLLCVPNAINCVHVYSRQIYT